MKKCFEDSSALICNSLSPNDNVYISFSGRSNGNCFDIAHHLMKKSDKYIAFKDISFNQCSKCEYECFKGECKYRNDDVYRLINASLTYKNIIFLVPIYCSNPSSIFFTFCERMQDFFYSNAKWDEFIDKMNIIAIFGSEEESPLFIPTLLQLVNGDESKILKIERHKYNLKLNDKVIDNNELLNKINSFNV